MKGRQNSYEDCRFDIGDEGGGLVHHIEQFLANDTFLDNEERTKAESMLKYFKHHIEVSEHLTNKDKLANLINQIDADYVIGFADQIRYVLNTTTPFSNYEKKSYSIFQKRFPAICWRIQSHL